MTDAVYLLILGQRVDCGLQVIWMFDILQEVFPKRRVGTSRIGYPCEPCRPVEAITEQESLTINQICETRTDIS